MTIKVVVKDGTGHDNAVKVTHRGQLITAPLEFSEFFNVEANVIDTAFNIIPPITGKRFVITTLVLHANKDVGVNDATVELYEADSIDSITVDKSIFTQEMLRQTALPLTSLNIITTEGKWLNVKTNDTTVHANIAGYYIDA